MITAAAPATRIAPATSSGASASTAGSTALGPVITMDRDTATGPGVAANSVTATPPAPPTDVLANPREPAVARALARWAARIEADGIGAHEDLARTLVAIAFRVGLCPVLVDVLADPREPAVARERAFGRLALALSTTRSKP